MAAAVGSSGWGDGVAVGGITVGVFVAGGVAVGGMAVGVFVGCGVAVADGVVTGVEVSTGFCVFVS